MDQRGVAAVEFALLLPVLIMVLFGIIEFGIALSRQQVLDTASREGASRHPSGRTETDRRGHSSACPQGVYPGRGDRRNAYDRGRRRGRPERDRSHRDGVGALSVLRDGEYDPGAQRDRDASIAHADET